MEDKYSNVEATDVNDSQIEEEQENPRVRWYIVHTYSGYENKVMNDINRLVQVRPDLAELIVDVKVPMEMGTEVRNGVRKQYERKKYPGYVMIKMNITDSSWAVVRNTRGVTGFVGTGNTPVPLTDEEVVRMGIEYIPLKMDIAVGDRVKIIANDAFSDLDAVVTAVNPEKMTVTIEHTLFGKRVPREIRACDICKI